MGSAPQRGTTQNFWVLLFCHDRLYSIWRRNPFRMGSAPQRGTTQNLATFMRFFFGRISRFTRFFVKYCHLCNFLAKCCDLRTFSSVPPKQSKLLSVPPLSFYQPCRQVQQPDTVRFNSLTASGYQKKKNKNRKLKQTTKNELTKNWNNQTNALRACCATAWHRQVIKKRKETNQFFKKWEIETNNQKMNKLKIETNKQMHSEQPAVQQPDTSRSSN